MNIKDIAKLSNVSKSTVSRVINNDKNVSEKTREKVLEIINEYNFVPNTNAKNLSSNKIKTIAIIIPNILNSFFSEIVDNIIKLAEKDDYKVIISISLDDYENEKRILSSHISDKIEKIILIPTLNTYEYLKFDESYKKILDNLKKEISLVIVDREISKELNGVYINNEEKGYLAIHKLSEKRNFDKFGIITGPSLEYNSIKRLNGALKYSVEYNKDILIYEGNYDLESGYNAYFYMKKNNILDVFVCNNLMAMGFIKAINEKEPENIKKYNIFSFEKIFNIEYFGIDISSFDINFKDIAKKSYEMVINRDFKEPKIIYID